MSSIPRLLRRRLRAEAIELCCAYCHSPETLLGLPLEADHITATSQGGQTVIGNLCLSCRTCNGYKAHRTAARDPVTGRTAKLFHPRRQKWPEHFQWSADGDRYPRFDCNRSRND